MAPQVKRLSFTISKDGRFLLRHRRGKGAPLVARRSASNKEKGPGIGRIDRRRAAKKGTKMADQNEPKAQKREVTVAERTGGLSVQDLILIAVLLAAGAVLKMTLASVLSFAGMKPNFLIAMYCLAILLTRAKPWQAAIIGLVTGLICQLPMMNATPWLNIPSELLGATAMSLLIHVPMKIKKVDLNPFVSTFLSTVVSGYTFAIILAVMNGISIPVALVTYALMVFGTATLNTILVGVLYYPLKKVLKR